MAPSHSRQLLALTLPTIAVILSYLWFKRKRIGQKSDPGDNQEPREEIRVEEKSLLQELEEAARDISAAVPTPIASPVSDRSFSRSLSGVETSPIDIIIPRELRSQKTSPIIISDEDLDLEIEKVKSMKNTVEPYHISKIVDTVDSPRKSPMKEVKMTKAEQTTPKTGKKQNGLTKNKIELNGKGKGNSGKASAQKKKMAKVEEKLDSLKLDNATEAGGDKAVKKEELEDMRRQSTERDSANHSPSDVMLASPSLSSISDNHSEGSSDSGKGGSDVATPPSRTPAGDALSNDVNQPTIYEFIIPQTLVGKLIGRYGSFVTEIKDKTRAHIIIKKHPSSNKLKVCAVEGTQIEIEKALRMIREKFPLKRYPEVTLEKVSFVMPMPNVPLTSDHLYLKLIEGINNDTIISCMVTPGHLFLQQPTHPSYPGLHVLTSCMNMCYNNNTESPNLPKPIQENTVCVAQSVGKWYRAMVLSVDKEADTSYVTFLDYGGYAFVENSNLKQIRGDFLLLPFQAAECMLANIKPVGGEDATWSTEAYDLVVELTKGSLTIAQIAEYTEQGVPLVLMYILIGPQKVVFLNDELVHRGFAEYTSSPPETSTTTSTTQIQGTAEGAVGGITA